MNIEHQFQRLKEATSTRGELKALAAEAGVPYTTALRMMDPTSRPAAIDNLAKLIAALDARSDTPAPEDDAEAA